MVTPDAEPNDTPTSRGILLFTVEDAFDITGVGCVLFHGVPDPSDHVPCVRRGAPIILRCPDASEIHTYIREFHSIRTTAPKPFTPISLPRNFTKSDVPP